MFSWVDEAHSAARTQTLFYYCSIANHTLNKGFRFLSVKETALNLCVFIFFKILVWRTNARGPNETFGEQSTQTPLRSIPPHVDCLFYSAWFFNSVCGWALKWETQTLRQCETAALMLWLYYYFIQLPSAISYSNDFCEEKKLNWHWHICPFFLIPLQENGFFSLQFIQLRIYSSAKSTIWYSLSLFFNLWSKSNHSKWLLMVIIATALYWSSGSREWKQAKHTEKRRGFSVCTITFGLFIWPLWRCNGKVLRWSTGFIGC